MRKGRTFVAIISYTVYCILFYNFMITFGNTGSASAFWLFIAMTAFGVFAIIITLGVFRWARKRFPQKKRNRNG